jgi:hypothetical protein
MGGQPTSIALLLDRNIPIAVSRAVALVRDDIKIHDEHFPRDIKDQELLRELGARDWAFVTRDKNIRRKPAEVRALREAGVRAFVLTAAGNFTRWQLLETLVRRWEDMVRYATSNHGPYLIGVTLAGGLRELQIGSAIGGA